MTTTTKKIIDPIDLEVGFKIRARRAALKMSQTTLGKACNITFQQVQKYEKGTNRVSASRLSQIAIALKCDVSDLFPAKGKSKATKLDAIVMGFDQTDLEVARLLHGMKPIIKLAYRDLMKATLRGQEVLEPA